MEPSPPRTIYTVGHSTRSTEELVALLREHGVRAIADVRAHPSSRRLPHFDAAALAASLPPAGIEYLPFISLGGRRKPAPDSPNAGWRNAAFRGYADFMGTGAFDAALAALEAAAAARPAATMCAEAVPWRCHRALISDALVVRGWRVIDILGPGGQTRVHALTPFARVEGTRVRYPRP